MLTYEVLYGSSSAHDMLTRKAQLGWKEVVRCTYDDEFPAGSSDKLRPANVGLADVIAREPLVA